jgi:hypothetical protein
VWWCCRDSENEPTQSWWVQPICICNGRTRRKGPRKVALVYNWWSSFVRRAEPKRSRKAITSRPLLLCGLGRLSKSGNQFKVQLTGMHEAAGDVQKLLTGLSEFSSGLRNPAEQLNPRQCWEGIRNRVLQPILPIKAAVPAPSG